MTKLWIKEQLLSEWFPYWSKEYKTEYAHRLAGRTSANHTPFTYRQVLWLDPKVRKSYKISNWYCNFTKEEKLEYHRKKYHEYKKKNWKNRRLKSIFQKIKRMREQQNIIL